MTNQFLKQEFMFLNNITFRNNVQLNKIFDKLNYKDVVLEKIFKLMFELDKKFGDGITRIIRTNECIINTKLIESTKLETVVSNSYKYAHKYGFELDNHIFMSKHGDDIYPHEYLFFTKLFQYKHIITPGELKKIMISFYGPYIDRLSEFYKYYALYNYSKYGEINKLIDVLVERNPNNKIYKNGLTTNICQTFGYLSVISDGEIFPFISNIGSKIFIKNSPFNVKYIPIIEDYTDYYKTTITKIKNNRRLLGTNIPSYYISDDYVVNIGGENYSIKYMIVYNVKFLNRNYKDIILSHTNKLLDMILSDKSDIIDKIYKVTNYPILTSATRLYDVYICHIIKGINMLNDKRNNFLIKENIKTSLRESVKAERICFCNTSMYNKIKCTRVATYTNISVEKFKKQYKMNTILKSLFKPIFIGLRIKNLRTNVCNNFIVLPDPTIF